MQIKVREFTGITDNIIEMILRMRGIPKDRVGKFLFPDDSMKPDYSLLDNIEDATALLKKHIDNDSEILIIADSDMDGYTSSGIMYQFIVNDLKYDKDKVDYYVHKGKVHGIPEEHVLEHKPQLLIVPDAGTSEGSIHKNISDNGTDVLILDHHLADRYSEFAVTINNQLSDNFKWKGLAGANIVHLFCEAYNDTYVEGKIDTDKYYNEAAIGGISDRAPLTDEGMFYYMHKGSQNVRNPFFKEIIANSRNMIEGEPLTPKMISWNIAPLINSMTRRPDKHEDTKLVVDAIMGQEYEVYNTRLKDNFSVAREALRKATNIRSQQSAKVKNYMEQLEERIEELKTHENQVLIVNATNVVEESSYTGLVATKLAEKYRRPTLVLKYYKEENKLTGSGRNFANSPLFDFRQTLLDTEKFEFALGHSSSFGCSIQIDNAMNIIDVLNEQLADVEYNDLTYEVDLSYSQKPDAEDILTIAQHEHIWGAGLESPIIHVSDIILDKKDIKFIGAKGNVWKLDMGSVEGILFSMTEQQKLELTKHESDKIVVEIVGECGINSYNGQNRPQINIKDFSVVEYTDEMYNPFGGMDIEVLPF